MHQFFTHKKRIYYTIRNDILRDIVVIFYPILCLLFLLNQLQGDEIEQSLREANEAYQKGLSQENVSQKQQYYNLALELYSGIEEKMKEEGRDLAPLYYDIGNLYFYLNEYPLAITYYYRAARTNPHDPKLIQNINNAFEKMGLSDRYRSARWNMYELLKLFGALTAIAIFLFSLHVWFKQPGLFIAALIFSIFATICLCFAIFIRSTTPIEAIIISPTLLRLGPDSDFPAVNETPLFPGSKIDVIDVAREGKWLKIVSPNHQIGYIYYKSVRVI